MKGTKLVNILRIFSKDEFKEFEKFIDSPFFSTGRNLKPLYIALKKFYPEFEATECTPEKIYSMLNKNGTYNALLVRKLFSDMTKLAESYLAYTGFRNAGMEKELFLLDEYNKRMAKTLFEPKLREAEHLLNTLELGDGYFLLKERLLETERDYVNKFSTQKSGRTNNEQSNNFLIYSLYRMHSIQHNNFVNRGNFNQKYENLLTVFLRSLNIEKLMNDLNAEKFNVEKQTEEIVKINLYGLKQLNSDFNDDDYLQYKKLIIKYISKYDRISKVGLIFALNNYNFKKVFESGGALKYYEEAFELFEMLFSKKLDIFNEKYYAPVTLFRSIIVIAHRLRKTEWIKNFIREDLLKLTPEFRNNMKHFANAYINFAEKNYEKTLRELNEVKFELFTFKIDVKSLLVQVYYEMGYNEQVLSLIDSIKHFMNESTNISEEFRNWIEPFVKAVYELVMINENYDVTKAGLFREKLSRLNEFGGKSWILEKLKEMKG